MVSRQTITNQQTRGLVCQLVRAQMVPADGQYNLEKGAYYANTPNLESPALSITTSTLNLCNENMRGCKCAGICLFPLLQKDM